MDTILFKKIQSVDSNIIKIIAQWYFDEWAIPIETTELRFSSFPIEGIPFQILMTLNNLPIATGGIYMHVGLLEREPRFNIYGPWLALVYTKLDFRNNGYGAMLCSKIQNMASELGLKQIFLFTHTAESLYKRIGWELIERVKVNNRDIAVMKMQL